MEQSDRNWSKFNTSGPNAKNVERNFKTAFRNSTKRTLYEIELVTCNLASIVHIYW